MNPVTPGAAKTHSFPEMRPHKKARGGSIQSYVNAPFVDAGAIRTANTAPHAVIPPFSFLISLLAPEFRSPLLTHTIESTLQSTFVASSKMLISGNQETVCCLLITSDCTAYYASEVNYQQNEGKIGPRL